MMNSLRQKITFGYATVGSLAVLLSLLSFLELRQLEEQIAASESISEFFGLTLEIRRFEKNFFLYRQQIDLAENRRYVSQAQTLLTEQAALFEALEQPEHIARLRGKLRQYAELIEQYGTGDDNALLEIRIRQAGKEIVTSGENLSRAERLMLQALLDRHRVMLIASVVAVTLLIVVIRQLLSRLVARPLQQLEESMEAVAAGKLTKLEMAAGDREIRSLTQAFNHVLQELENRQGQLVRSEKLAALGTLLSGVAHELNNPLSNISSSCEILAEEIDGHHHSFKKELLGQIDEETWRARRIVRSLLDYARGQNFRKEAVPLPQLLEDTLRLIKGQIPPRISVVRRIPGELVVTGDKQRLQQLLFNLISNAVAAIDGAGEILVTAQRTCMPLPTGALVFGQSLGTNESIEIEVRDNGPGIPFDLLPRIFDPFFTTKEVGKGMGLGLFIVFEIVEEHGGCIAVESAPGKGAAFFVRLPPGEYQ